MARAPRTARALARGVQRWRHVSFLHWPLPAGVVAARLPTGLEPDLWDGHAWVNLTPFLVEGFPLPPFPPSPLPGPAQALPVPRDQPAHLRAPPRRRRGSGSSPSRRTALTVASAWVGTGVPYRWSAMGVETGETVRYSARRRRPIASTATRIAGRPAASLPAGAVPER